jgi:(p)ppGpp synthase/HD superfamily hydrolase
MTKLERAIQLAVEAHAGQVDKAGVPYILHPLRVMLKVSDNAKVVAVLHDVVEDTDFNIVKIGEFLGEHRLTVNEINALGAVTRKKGETYREFINQIADCGGIAKEIKIADIRDNLGRLTPELRGLEKRYFWALEALGVEDF